MLNVNNISVFFGGKPIFENVSFQVQSKDRIGLIGKNGAGKSTLLKLISGSIKADSGSIDFSTGYKIGILTQDLHLDTSKSVRTSAKEAFSEILEVEAKIEKQVGGGGIAEQACSNLPTRVLIHWYFNQLCQIR